MGFILNLAFRALGAHLLFQLWICSSLYLLHHTETLENHGPGSLDEGGFSKSTYGYLQETSNLRNKLIRARIPDPSRMRSKWLIPGMKPCGLDCPTCPYIEPGTVIQSSYTSKKIEIDGTFNSKTRNVVFVLQV